MSEAIDSRLPFMQKESAISKGVLDTVKEAMHTGVSRAPNTGMEIPNQRIRNLKRKKQRQLQMIMMTSWEM
jgi:hypothetical protein